MPPASLRYYVATLLPYPGTQELRHSGTQALALHQAPKHAEVHGVHLAVSGVAFRRLQNEGEGGQRGVIDECPEPLASDSAPGK